jgi:hypothetical protein
VCLFYILNEEVQRKEIVEIRKIIDSNDTVRVAMLFASFDNHGFIELRHWARAQLFIEHCREGLHHFYAQVNLTESLEKQREDKIYQTIQKAGRSCIRDISRMTHESSGKVRQHIQELERAGLLCSEKLLAPNGREVTWYWCVEEK